jgi:hypothetical protein
MVIKNIIYRGQARAVEDAVEAWKLTHLAKAPWRDLTAGAGSSSGQDEVAETVKDVEAIVDASLQLHESLVAWQKESWEAIRSGREKRILALGNSLEKAYQANTDIFKAVSELLDWAKQNGYDVASARLFHERVADLRKLRDRFVAKWPFPKIEEMEEAIAQIARGEGIELEELIRELQSQADS